MSDRDARVAARVKDQYHVRGDLSTTDVTKGGAKGVQCATQKFLFVVDRNNDAEVSRSR